MRKEAPVLDHIPHPPPQTNRILLGDGLALEDAEEKALIARGVIGDFRAPATLRFGFSPLPLRYVDVWDAVDALADIMTRETWRAPEFAVVEKVT